MNGFICAIFITFTIMCVSAHDGEWKKANDECKAEVGLSEDQPKSVLHDFENQKVRCLFACIFKKMGTLVDGKIDSDKSIEKLSQWRSNVDENTKDKIKECATTANEQVNECDIAGNFSKCVMGVLPHEEASKKTE